MASPFETSVNTGADADAMVLQSGATETSAVPAATQRTPDVAPPSNLLRNQSLSIADLPEHPVLAQTSVASSLQSFLHALLTPALQLADTTWPKQWTGGNSKASKPASAKVKLYRWEDNRADQTWFIRRSTHANVADAGTFTWAELDDSLRIDHSQREAEYTPDIYQSVEICRWGPEQGLTDGILEGFSAIDMRGEWLTI